MTLPACAFRIPLTDKLKGREIGGIKLSVNMNQEEIYQELRRRAVVAFGEDRAAELEDYLRRDRRPGSRCRGGRHSPGPRAFVPGVTSQELIPRPAKGNAGQSRLEVLKPTSIAIIRNYTVFPAKAGTQRFLTGAILPVNMVSGSPLSRG